VSRQPAYQRLDVDERRRQLLHTGLDLFTRHAYADLSMAAIAREAGISKALLYHYFPSKQAFFVAVLREEAEELVALTATDPDRSPVEQLTTALDAFLTWVEAHDEGYARLLQSAGTHAEVRELMERVRIETADRILRGMAPQGAPGPLRSAVIGWLWFMDGVLADWLENRDYDREQLRGLLLGTLLGAVTAAGGT
jgi:AcrR family transcriptional regulator